MKVPGWEVEVAGLRLRPAQVQDPAVPTAHAALQGDVPCLQCHPTV